MPENSRSYQQRCGIATALDVIGDRWAALIIRDLLLGPMRFGDLVQGLPGIGTNTLTTRLKHLESCGVIRRTPQPAPERGTAYELTPLGRELEPILMALGRWGAKSMRRLPADAVSRSRWLVAAMLAFHDDTRRVNRTTTWELRLDDGPFTVRAVDVDLSIAAGAPEQSADLVITATDEQMHALLTRRIAADAVRLDGDESALPRLLELFEFPA